MIEDDLPEFIALDELGWCTCGSSEEVEEQILLYLRALLVEPFKRDMQDVSAAWAVIAYVCDKAGWTEHGSSVGYSWLTSEGKEMLRKLEIEFDPEVEFAT